MTDDGYPVFGANGYIGYYSEYNYDTDQICVSCRGTVGEVNTVKAPVYITGNSMVCSIKDKSCIVNEYLAYSLVGTGLESTITGGVQKQITQTNLGKLELPIPPLSEQKRIASYLDKQVSLIDKQIGYYSDLIVNMKSFKQSIISEAVTGKL